MRVYYSTLCQIGSGLPESLDEMIRHGGDAIELMLDGPGWDESQIQGRETAEYFRAKPAVYSVHTPVWDMNLTSENARARMAARNACRDSIVFASAIRAAHVVIHPGFCETPVFDKKAARKRAVQALEEGKQMLLRIFPPDENRPDSVNLKCETKGVLKS